MITTSNGQTNHFPLTESRAREIAREVFHQEFSVQREKSKEAERFFDAREAAQFIHASLSKLYRLTSKGEVPYMKCHGKLLFDRAELAAWIRASKKVTVENCV